MSEIANGDEPEAGAIGETLNASAFMFPGGMQREGEAPPLPSVL